MDPREEFRDSRLQGVKGEEAEKNNSKKRIIMQMFDGLGLHSLS